MIQTRYERITVTTIIFREQDTSWVGQGFDDDGKPVEFSLEPVLMKDLSNVLAEGGDPVIWANCWPVS